MVSKWAITVNKLRPEEHYDITRTDQYNMSEHCKSLCDSNLKQNHSKANEIIVTN